jgi:predicted nuclease of restriction endonuclease-like (RecB) superfamily
LEKRNIFHTFAKRLGQPSLPLLAKQIEKIGQRNINKYPFQSIVMKNNIATNNTGFKEWLVSLKTRIRQSQIKAAIRVNEELLYLYWDLGHDIVVRQMDAVWGSGFFEHLSKELRAEFPEMKGFSVVNLRFCKRFYNLYSQGAFETPQIRQQPVSELQNIENKHDIIHPQFVDEFKTPLIFQIPWGHHVQIINKCETVSEALFYVRKTAENGWSRATLVNFMDTNLYQRQGKALNNFDRLLPEVHGDLAKEIMKNPYNFDFLTLTGNYKEREFESALADNITKMLLELGKGFAYVGRQVPIQAGSKELFMDMLFYHLKLRCYVVVELKTCEFDGAFTGQLGVYVSAVNHQLRGEFDNPTLGLLICKTKDNVMAQYSLESSSQPIVISEYELSQLFPENLKSALPSIEEIEEKLKP